MPIRDWNWGLAPYEARDREEVIQMGEEERKVDSTGTDGVRDPAGDSGRPQESDIGARAPEPGTSALDPEHEEVQKAEEAQREGSAGSDTTDE